MPPGSKKRKALKKKKEQEAIGNSTNNTSFNSHGHDEHGSQDVRGSDGNLSSPGSQGNLSHSPLSGLGKVTTVEKTEVADVTNGQVAKGTDREENSVDKPINSLPESFARTTRKAADDIATVVDSVSSKVEISDKNEQVESSTLSDSVEQKSDENRLQEAKEGNSSGSPSETSKDIKNVKDSIVLECSEEKSLMPSAPPVVRTSWLSCCGLFDVMAGSER